MIFNIYRKVERDKNTVVEGVFYRIMFCNEKMEELKTHVKGIESKYCREW
jgi:hypothetical protein